MDDNGTPASGRKLDKAETHEEATFDSMAAFVWDVGILVLKLKIRTCFTWSEAVCLKMVEIASCYWQASPQVRTHANQLSTLPIPTPEDPDPVNPRPHQEEPRPWALSRRLTPETRAAIVAAYQAGARQQDLATHHNLSLSSIKRLVRKTK